MKLTRATGWLIAAAGAAIALVFFYPDSYQQDAGYHFLFARWAWRHPAYFVSVWGRPLFTLLYSFPAQLGAAHTGYRAARLFTVAVCLLTAWQTERLARQAGLARAELAIPLLFLQPSYLLLCGSTLTEPLFALVLVLALRLHLRGRAKAAMLVASLLILARPEGLFLGLLWGAWILRAGLIPGSCFLMPEKGERTTAKEDFFPVTGIRNQEPGISSQVLLLGSGMLLWFGAAWLITGDPLRIAHDWPPDWQADGHANGTGPLWWYAAMLPLIVGPLLVAPFVVGLRRLLQRREFGLGVAAFLVLFGAHSLLYWRGWFGSAGYPRYLVCVAPATALITLAGFSRGTRKAAIAATLMLSALASAVYVDGWLGARDAWAVDELHAWFSAHERPLASFIFSQAYACLRFDRDPWERPAFNADRARNLELLRQAPARSLALWDDETGPKWYRLRAEDFTAAGYTLLRAQDFRLRGWLLHLPWERFGGARAQRMYLFYKE